ncbi:RNA-binding S4 domain-containing protein [Vibrio metoecus]|uniref:RNA-binding S4 domain-containing protein n=1 Tax=Vibrio metoecus TaxID=1481663 RepID=UPI00215C3491|nr:RNA-binding S4 domain-containing protein [Vibrio metoecus]MCR9386680.1 RNA-binding S4 domain-containing protein [Vibrio metoecus]
MTDEQFNPQDEEIEIEAIGVEVSSQPIELYKVLKIANAISGGGEAKHVISEGYVFVNGEEETRKRRKVYNGDLIEFNQEFYVVICDVPVTESVPSVAALKKSVKNEVEAAPSSKKASAKKKEKAQKNSSKTKQNKSKEEKKPASGDSVASSGRSAIRFF